MTDSTLDTFRQRANAFGAIANSVPAASWDNPTPCAEWTARDIVAHAIDTERDFLTRHEIDLGEAPDPGDPAAAWTRHTDAVTAALADGVAERQFDGYFGPSTLGDTMANFYGWDLIAHRWDLARATDQDAGLTDDEVAFVDRGADGFGEQLYGAGICAPAVPAPADASPEEALIARLGRDPRWVPAR